MNNRIILAIIGVTIVLATLVWYGSFSGLLQTRLPGVGGSVEVEQAVETIEESLKEEIPAPVSNQSVESCAEICQQSTEQGFATAEEQASAYQLCLALDCSGD